MPGEEDVGGGEIEDGGGAEGQDGPLVSVCEAGFEGLREFWVGEIHVGAVEGFFVAGEGDFGAVVDAGDAAPCQEGFEAASDGVGVALAEAQDARHVVVVEEGDHVGGIFVEAVIGDDGGQIGEGFVFAKDVAEGEGQGEVEHVGEVAVFLDVVHFCGVSVEVLAQEDGVGVALSELGVEGFPEVESDVFDGVESETRDVGECEVFLGGLDEVLGDFWIGLVEVGESVNLSVGELDGVVPVLDGEGWVEPVGFLFDEGGAVSDVVDDEIEDDADVL